MARKPRIHLPGGIYHVMLRGNDGQPVFFSDQDRLSFCELVAEGVARYGHRVHAFCLMTNHVHFALQVAATPLAKIVQNLAFRYTRRINKSQRRIGHLFQGRYKALLVDADAYLVELVRYIHLNPVRAQMVADPGAYSWSGHNAYLGLADWPWLTTDLVLSQFATQRSTAAERYRRFVCDAINDGRREEFHVGHHNSQVCGSDVFLQSVYDDLAIKSTKPPTLDKIVSVTCEQLKIAAAELHVRDHRRWQAKVRAIIALIVQDLNCATLKETADYFHRDATVLGRSVVRLRVVGDRQLQDAIDVIKKALAAGDS